MSTLKNWKKQSEDTWVHISRLVSVVIIKDREFRSRNYIAVARFAAAPDQTISKRGQTFTNTKADAVRYMKTHP
jgi:hypothetical protein|tara:strand:+ start:3227 stop:3448 length:222 start_codon:yes stop_codon:yes gene_type:complete